jgi:hypothetical protein
VPQVQVLVGMGTGMAKNTHGLPMHFTTCEIQLAIFLNCACHYGNAATIQDIADWAGISVGSIYNCTNCVMIAIALLHDLAISRNLHDPDCIREKAKAKESRTCGEWRDGYLTSDGSCFSLF